MKILVGVSNRHIHLNKNDADILFGKDHIFTKRNDLRQTGQYACEEVVKISTDKYEFSYVRVLLPLRDYTQVEISNSDSLLLGIDPPVRDSGDLENSEAVYIEGPNGKIYKKNCCIIANKHIHCSKLDNIGYSNCDIVNIKSNNTIINDVHIKENDDFLLEFHINKDEANLYGINTGDYIELE